MGCSPNSGVTPLFPMRTVLLASSQSCRSVDSEVWCKWDLRSSQIVIQQMLSISMSMMRSESVSVSVNTFRSISQLVIYILQNFKILQYFRCFGGYTGNRCEKKLATTSSSASKLQSFEIRTLKFMWSLWTCGGVEGGVGGGWFQFAFSICTT